ncbi:hypothetical protein OG879_04675 [Streptomyces caniferus]|uniref:hypothetical protein n=1 Tax=Streptomyces caniferus TaxID=285557 RepID=UPI002E2A8ADF|nr:hypothetical protein [Streptomyces caniferus]
MLGDPLDRRPGFRQCTAGLLMHSDLHRPGLGVVQNPADQIVPERQLLTGLGQDSRLDDFHDQSQHLTDAPAEHLRQQGDREARADHRSHPQQMEGVRGQETQTVHYRVRQ